MVMVWLLWGSFSEEHFVFENAEFNRKSMNRTKPSTNRLPRNISGLIQDFLLVSRALIRLIGLNEFRNDRLANYHGEGAMINQHLGDHVTESQKSPYFWKAQFSFWVAYTLLQGVIGFALITNGIISRGSEGLLLELILLKSACGFLITSFLRPLLIWIHSRKWHPLRMSLLLLGLSLSYITVELLLITQIPFVVEHFKSLTVTPSTGSHVMVLGFYLDLFFFAFWVGFYFAASLFFDSVELSRRQQKSEHALLRSQMQPHFLFNALTAVMAVSDDKEKVEELTQSLADYLHFSLSKRNDDTSPLGDELDALENYLHVEKIRFAENLNYQIDADQGARAFMVPSQLVQPLLENAIKYGQQTSPMPLSIRIHTQLTGESLHLVVENSGSWVESPKSKSHQIGVENLRRRLKLVYGDRASLVYDNSPERVRAMVALPIMKP
jgi:signal transduction histidine kinase